MLQYPNFNKFSTLCRDPKAFRGVRGIAIYSLTFFHVNKIYTVSGVLF